MISRYVNYSFLRNLRNNHVLPFCKITIDSVSIHFQEDLDELASASNIVGIKGFYCS